MKSDDHSHCVNNDHWDVVYQQKEKRDRKNDFPLNGKCGKSVNRKKNMNFKKGSRMWKLKQLLKTI